MTAAATEPEFDVEATNETAPETEQDTTQPDDVDDQVVDETPSEPTDAQLGREAAKYRRQLRDTEAERNQLRNQLEAMQRDAVERLAASHVRKPSVLWKLGLQLADVLDGDGLPDPEKVRTAATHVATDQGLSKPLRNYAPREGTNGEPPRPTANSRMKAVIQGRDG